MQWRTKVTIAMAAAMAVGKLIDGRLDLAAIWVWLGMLEWHYGLLDQRLDVLLSVLTSVSAPSPVPKRIDPEQSLRFVRIDPIKPIHPRMEIIKDGCEMPVGSELTHNCSACGREYRVTNLRESRCHSCRCAGIPAKT